MSAVLGNITDLASVFGAMPGDDRVLVDWEPMCSWLDDIVEASPRLHMETIGTSTSGADLRMIIASAPETLGDLQTIRQHRTQLKRADAFREPGTSDGTRAGSKPIVLITAGIHATEVGGVQMMPGLIRDLATLPAYHALLDKIIVLVVPTLNPDGVGMVHAWYRRTLGTNAEGTVPPALYHRYAGHDNNRDWYQRRLEETRAVVDNVLRVWMPHVVIDLHQMGQKSPRYVVPPYIDPAEPHVHPLVYQLAAELGSRIAADHIRAGNQGICSGVMFDCYSPTRAYMHYHGGVRVLAEAASAGIASPVSLSADDLHLWDDAPVDGPSVHMPLPWRGDTWRLGDIIRLHRGTIDSVLRTVAQEPARWIADQWRMLSDQVNRVSREVYVIPPLRHQIDPAAARELLDVLHAGDAEIRVAAQGAGAMQANSFVIDPRQPFGSYAEALLGPTDYPSALRAYDVTSHLLPVHMGVQVERHEGAYPLSTRGVDDRDLVPFEAAQAADVRAGAWLAIDDRSHASIRLVNHAIATGSRVKRLTRPLVTGRRMIGAGTWLIADASIWDIMAHAAGMHVRTWIVPAAESNAADVVGPRIGLYNPQHVGMSDYGWLTLWLKRAGFSFTPVTSDDIVHGTLDRIDVMLFPHGDTDALLTGHPSATYPTPFTRGLSGRFSTALRTWMHRGGHIIAFEGSVRAVSSCVGIELRQPLERLPDAAFHSSGAVVRLQPAPGVDTALGIHEPFPAMYFSPYGYEVADSAHQLSIARFPREGAVISGAMHGAEHLGGLHAVVQMTPGEGCFTAFAFRPHFRTQMLASERLLTNAIFHHHRREGHR